MGPIDCVHCHTNEFQTDPSSKWYSHKHNGAGVSYEVVIDLCANRATWIAGPYPASTHDITVFCSGTQVSQSQRNDKTYWDWNALYFNPFLLVGKTKLAKYSQNWRPHDPHPSYWKRQNFVTTCRPLIKKRTHSLKCAFCHIVLLRCNLSRFLGVLV